ncbi:formate/nitrite transporter family protein, partial [Vibrio parahaemolyticus]|nr:formate/nitrite transporter family protein [Vibrio parahaemolyticus]
AFSMGLILIVICGGELFTSSVLSSISWANKQISFGKMLSIWGKVYVGNFIGAMFLLALVSAAGLYQLDHGQWGLNALNIAQHKLHHTMLQAFALGVLCNLLVCLAIWLTFSSANAMTKAAMTIMPVAMFVSSGFEHCVANMFMVPL